MFKNNGFLKFKTKQNVKQKKKSFVKISRIKKSSRSV